MKSIDIWNEKWIAFKTAPTSSGSYVPANLSDIFHIYEEYIVNKTISIDRTMKVLDIGAGAGRWTRHFAQKGAEVLALEPTNAYFLLKENTAFFNNVSCRKLFFSEFESSETFDLIIISGVLTYMDDQNECDGFVQDALNLLSPGGHLILREPVVRHKKLNRFKSSSNNGKPLPVDYLEVSRSKTYYDSICSSTACCKIKSTPNHASILYHLRIPGLKTLINKCALKLFNPDHLTFWYLYNALLNRPIALLKLAFNIPQMYIMIYQKQK